MYGGEVMEAGSADDIFEDPHHPYTLGLQNAFPNIEGEPSELVSIPGTPPALSDPPKGCPFRSRCPFEGEECATSLPETGPTDDHRVYCHAPESYRHMKREAGRRETWKRQTH
jgi:oligopeptide/dipeptide ABC transporter ATP-binding protein